MTRYHRFQKISPLMLIIMLISGMCFDSFRTDSISYCSSTNNLQVIQEITPCTLTMEMVEIVTYPMAQHLTARTTGAWSNSCKLISSAICCSIFPLPIIGLYSQYSTHFTSGRLTHRCIITYIHKSDGKKRI